MSDLDLTNGTNDSGGGGDVSPAVPARPVPAKSGGKITVEKTYQKKSQLEHILLRPDTYIGSVETHTEMMWVYNAEENKMERREISYVPGLFKIFDEILVNAADNKQRDPTMTKIEITIKPEENTISIYNNGKGIPVVMHKDEKMYVPTMIFGHLLTSSNYNDEDDKVTGGRNGYGAKLCNIFSTSFIVETASKEYKKCFRQKWADNMTKVAEPKVKDIKDSEREKDYTKITFCPDLAKFKMEKLDKDIVDLMSRRACDIAASTGGGVKVLLNGKDLKLRSFRNYIELYTKDKVDDDENPLKIVHERVNDRWEVAVTMSDQGFQQISFVNSIATTKGGRHVDYVLDMVIKKILAIVKKRNRNGVALKPFQVKSHLWIFINCLIVNPTFDSQTKENMTLQQKNFGSKCNLSDKFILAVTKCGIVEAMLVFAKSKEQNELVKKSSAKKRRLKGVAKLEDANDAGTKDSINCTLILTEGDSAKSLAVSGLGVIGRDRYGVFPLRGKLLNVREANHLQITKNAEIDALIKILGLQYKKKYETIDDLKTLRYGKVMIMTDQDQDGSHIKGLIINFLHFYCPTLLKMNFVEEFITPLIKVFKGKATTLSFFSMPEFEEWKRETDNWHTWRIKYYKGLGTSDSNEAKEYFSNMTRHRIKFKYSGEECDKAIQMAFSKKAIELRKEWLTNWMTECKRREELGLPEDYLYTKETRYITYKDFINKELILFSNMDVERSIPSAVDGFKPGQRKVMFTCMKRNDKREIKVAQLAGSVAEQSAYHHGEQSLMSTIINLAQNYVGSNNINLLQPRGQFGSRLQGGKDAASPRYIFTLMSPLTRLIFHPADDPLLKYNRDDNLKVEPVWYIPVIPMILVNGAEGIGTGWSTKIPNYNPREIVANLKKMIEGDEEAAYMKPWYKNFKGDIIACGDKYYTNGEINIINNTTLEITELPIGTWTQPYKESVMEVMLNGAGDKCPPSITEYKEYNTDTTVKFVVSMSAEKLAAAEHEGLHKFFKLQSSLHTSYMCAFDKDSCLKKYNNVAEIMTEFYALRLQYYEKRKDHQIGTLEAESKKLSNQARFICEKCDNVLVVENKKKKDMIAELVRKKYDSDPVKAWRLQKDREAALEDDFAPQSSQTEDEEGEETTPENVGPDFDYLLGMPLWNLTKEKKDEMLKKRDDKMTELRVLIAKSPKELWNVDLDAILEKLEEVEKMEKEEQESAGQVKAKGAKVKGATLGKAKKAAVLKSDFMPSPVGRRVEPIVKLDKVPKEPKEPKIKKKKTDDVKDEFDMLAESYQKTLTERLGNSPQLIEKKMKAKKKEKAEKEVKPKKPRNASPKKGSPKKRKDVWDSNEEDDGIEDDRFSDDGGGTPKAAAPVRQTARRSAAANIKFKFDDASSEEEFYENLEVVNGNDEPNLHEDLDDGSFDGDFRDDDDASHISDSDGPAIPAKKPPVKKPPAKKQTKAKTPPPSQEIKMFTDDSESDNDFMKKPSDKLGESSEDQFNSLFSSGSKKTTNLISSGDDSPVTKPPPKKNVAAERKPRKPTAKRPKKSSMDSDSDSAPAPKTKKARGKKKVGSDDEDEDEFRISSDEEIVPRQKPASVSGRARKPAKYKFDDDDEDSDY